MLTKLDRPILVIVDDLDRLSSNEIKLMFQLIKANANFPNMVYLLLFQRDIVEKSLKDIAPTNEREFLDKIVQVGFDIPKVEQTRIEKILSTGLEELLNKRDAGKHFDNNRWGNIFIPGLRPYFRTLRDVYRFLNTLSFHVSLFTNNETFEVNPVDLIALEVLRVFEPDVYKQLSEAKSILTDMHDDSVLFQSSRDEARSVVESIVRNVSKENSLQVKEILKQLFPSIEWVFSGHGYGAGFEEQWFRELRVCHPDIFDRYFLFSIPEGDISQADLDVILSLTSNREALVTKFKSLNERGLLSVALNRLEAYKQKIDLKYAVPFITSLFDIGDKLPIEETGLYGIDPETHASRIIHWYLKQEKDNEARGKILKEAMKATTGLYLPVMKTSIEVSRHEKKNEPDAFTVDEDDLIELKKICIDKIKESASSWVLKKHHKMAYILYRWREWGSPEEPQKWVKELVETKEGLLSFLTYFLQKSTSQEEESYVYKTHYYIKLKNIEDFIPVDIIKCKIENLPTDDLTDQEQKAVDAFKKALKEREEGKPDESKWGDE